MRMRMRRGKTRGMRLERLFYGNLFLLLSSSCIQNEFGTSFVVQTGGFLFLFLFLNHLLLLTAYSLCEMIPEER